MLKKLLSTTAITLLSLSPLILADQQVVLSKEDDAKSDVTVLTNDNFDKYIKTHQLSLVEFYAPWCGHCKKLKPEYEKAATALKNDNISLGKVDCTVEEELCKKFGVRGYPTLKVFRNGTDSEYKGEREAESIVKTMQVQALPSISLLEGDKVDTFSTSDRVVVIGFFSGPESAEFSELSAVANKLRDDYRFGASFEAAPAKKFGVNVPGLILFKKFDEGKNIFNATFTEEDISTFVKTNAIPLMDDIGPENYGTFMESSLPLAYLFVSTESERAEFGPKVEAVAKELKGKMNFVYIDAIKFGAHAENLNLNKDQWPAFAIQSTTGTAKYPFDQSKEITTEAIKAYAEGVLDGTIKRKIKSVPLKGSNDGPVFVINGDTFESVTKDPTKHVLVEFYAEWCGHCQKLAPVYDKLGSLYKGNEDIRIAKINAPENDHGDEPVGGFPTIKLYKAGDDKTPIEYDGNRSLESFIEFIEKHTSIKIDYDASADKTDESKQNEHDEL